MLERRCRCSSTANFPSRDEEQLEVHIDECDACRDALAREKLLFKSLDAAEIVPSAELLADCRAQLRQRLEHVAPERARFWDKIRQGFTINFHFAPVSCSPLARSRCS